MFVVTTSVVLFSDVCSNDFSRYPSDVCSNDFSRYPSDVCSNDFSRSLLRCL
ncbi:MAG: hypothetical protein ACRC8Y_14045 [Chroococcales cyanobacterium]